MGCVSRCLFSIESSSALLSSVTQRKGIICFDEWGADAHNPGQPLKEDRLSPTKAWEIEN